MILVGILVTRSSAGAVPLKNDFPCLSIIIAACNEESHLEDGVASILGSDYPHLSIEIIVVTDDGSTDATISIAKKLHDLEKIKHLHNSVRGKNACLDFGISHSRFEIVVFKDGTGKFHPKALMNLARHFIDHRVGCVGGYVRFIDTDELGSFERIYWIYETLVRRGTEYFGYLPSAAGGIHAMRRSLYQPVSNNITRDMVDPVQCIAYGYTAIMDDSAICFEEPWSDPQNVYNGRVRVTKRAWAAFMYNTNLLVQAGRFKVLAVMALHKACRFLLWVPLALILILNLYLSAESSFFRVLLAIQIFAYLVGMTSILLARWRIFIPGASFVGFILLNIVAMADGTVRYAAGTRSVTWR